MKKLLFTASVLLAGASTAPVTSALDWSLEAGIEGRRFLESGAYSGQVDDQWSITLQPEVVWDAESGNGRFTFVPFFRKDFADDERTHGDIREAMFMTWDGPWELRAGIGKVFWGVTESLHLVDVINQTDYVEAIDGDQKLGQPMIQGIWLSDMGTWEAFVLPGFRERTFPGEAGRYRTELLVSDDAEYQADEEQQHVDLAARWSYVSELNGYPLDLTASVFRGTSRDPLLAPQVEVVNSVLTLTELVPYYAMQNQIGSTIQFAPEGWLLKAELLYRDYQLDALPGGIEVKGQTAAVGGFEYTLVGPFGDAADLGLLAEYQYDSRGADYSDAQNDLFLGTRYVFNDMASSEILAGITQDLDYMGTRLFLLEANTRLNPSMTIDATITLVTAEEESLASIFRRDDTFEVALNFFF